MTTGAPVSDNLSVDQATAYDALAAFIEAPYVDRRYRVLHGLAGTGKTTLLARIARDYPGVALCALTGKAASVLRQRVDMDVSTVHSAIYNFCGLGDEDLAGHREPIFTPKGESLRDRVVLVDESSMLGRRIASDLLATGARIVASGDLGQLPPVRDAQFFTAADVTLTEIHRQALDSPIIRQAHRVRTAGRYDPDGEGFRVISFATPEELLGHDMLLCWRNRTRRKLNERKRALLRLRGPLGAGEPIMCLRNDHRFGLYNGAVYDLLADLNEGRLTVLGERGPVRVDCATVEGFDPEFKRNQYDDDYLPFAPAYAATVHKSQGSEYRSVLLFDEADRDWTAFIYTGITRAVERCTVVRWR